MKTDLTCPLCGELPEHAWPYWKRFQVHLWFSRRRLWAVA